MSLISNVASQTISTKEKEGWKIIKQDKSNILDWIIYKREIGGRKLLEYKIEGEIKSSPSTCVISFRQDIYNLSKGNKNHGNYKYITYDIVDDSKESLSVYAIHNEPFPLKNTEMSIKYTFFNDDKGNEGIKWIEAWDENPVPFSKKLSRVEKFRGSWQFVHTSNATYKAVNTIQADLKKFPLWLAQPMIIKFLKKGLEDMRNIKSK